MCHSLAFASWACLLHFYILSDFCYLGDFRLYSSCGFLWGSVDAPLVVVQPSAHVTCSTFYLVGCMVSSMQGVLLSSFAFGTGWFGEKSLFHKEAPMDGEKTSIKHFIAPILKPPCILYPNITLCMQVCHWLSHPIKSWSLFLSFVHRNFWIIWGQEKEQCWFCSYIELLDLFSAVSCVLILSSPLY